MGAAMSADTPELRELVALLTDLAAKKYGPKDGILAVVFLADALRSGGVEPARLQMGVTKIQVERRAAGDRLRATWDKDFGLRERAELVHQVLFLDDILIDPVIRHLRIDEGGYYPEAAPAFYGAIARQAIYQK